MGQPLWPSSCILSHKATISSLKHSFQAYFLSDKTTILCLLSVQQVQICVRPITDINKHCRIHLSKQHRIKTHYHPAGTWPWFRKSRYCDQTNSYVYDNWHFTRKNSQLHSNKGYKSVSKDKAEWQLCPRTQQRQKFREWRHYFHVHLWQFSLKKTDKCNKHNN